MNEKSILLIGGGGTLGTYCYKELLKCGYSADVICLEDKDSDNPRLHFIKARADYGNLKEIVTKKHYDGIVNFILYSDIEEYKPVHLLLTSNTTQLIAVSSYRVYAEDGVITEDTPFLADVSEDAGFLRDKSYYPLAKAALEKYIRSLPQITNYTIVRPVISFSSARLDIVTRSGHAVSECLAENKPLLLPKGAAKLVAGLDWAGNTGKIIADLFFKEGTLGQAYTVSSAQNLTWKQIADYYTELCGLKIQWIDDGEYAELFHKRDRYILCYDRLFNRKIDNTKVLKATGLKPGDFTPIKEGIAAELKNLGIIK